MMADYNQGNEDGKKSPFHDICLQDRCISPNSDSSQEVMFSSSSTPLGTPFNISSENLRNDNLLGHLKAFEENYEEKIKTLTDEKNLLINEIKGLKNKIIIQEDEFGKTVEDIKRDFHSKLDKINKERENSRKDLESMVVKYAKSEKEVIISKKAREDSEKKLRDALKEKENLLFRIKGLNCDKSEFVTKLEKKISEYLLLQKEMDKLKEELRDRDAALMIVQHKLKQEIQSHQETCKKFSHMISSQSEKDDEIENQKVGDKDFQIELDRLKNKCESLERDNHSLTVKIQSLERERLDHEEVVCKLKDTLNDLRSKLLDCNAKLNQLDEIKLSLQREKELMESTQNELDRVKEANAELVAEMEACRHKEGELLEFTERLTAKSVNLQSEHNALEQKCSTLTEELNRSAKQYKDSQEENISLKAELNSLKLEKDQEVNILVRKIAEKSKGVDELKSQIEELENENKVMKKRHLNSVKELNREIVQMRKQLEIYEDHSDKKPSNQETVFNSSNSSFDGFPQATNHTKSPQKEINGCSDDGMPQFEAMLVNKIIKLQKTVAKKQEKIDFLEEHIHQLLQAMKDRTK